MSVFRDDDADLLVMRPHSEDTDNTALHPIDEAVLAVYAAGVKSVEVANRLFKGRWTGKRVLCHQIKKRLGSGLKTRLGNKTAVLYCLMCKNDLIHHQGSSGSYGTQSSKGSAAAALRLSVIPGMEVR